MHDSPSGVFHSAPSLRQEVRRLTRDHRLPAELVTRLVLSVSRLAADTLHAGFPVTLHTGADAETPVHLPEHYLVLTLGALTQGHRAPEASLLPPAYETRHSVTWLVPLPRDADARPSAPPTADDCALSDTEAYERELLAALARVDALTVQHRDLKHELAETNGGVLALYVQLEEREEQLRTAHGRMLLDLENALRPAAPHIPGAELAVYYAPSDPAAPTGGDLYDWFAMPDGTLHITVVDALGHGIRSTRTALSVTHAVRALALEGHPLQTLIARTHHQLTPIAAEMQATALLARLDPHTGALHLAGGGHPPALLLRADGHTAQFLPAPGRGVGFPLPGSEDLRHEILAPGDLLILYTDGLTESRRNPVEGELRLIASARRHAHLPVRDIPAAIAADMHTVVLHSDDTLALALRIT
ncbi:PP2C family protein-serine/threonine phosphatase [Streptomyces sp. NPDC058657]|uniref:PP2C family protein-serine/threonine phosphatase n=1 Tax=unclassified Streptomyces TaxID=2593676 RepID=UPI0036494A25